MANMLRTAGNYVNYTCDFIADLLYFRIFWRFNVIWDKFGFKRPNVPYEKRMKIFDFAWTLEKPYARKFIKSANGNFLSIFVSDLDPKPAAYVLTKDFELHYFHPSLYKYDPEIQEETTPNQAIYINSVRRENQAKRKIFESLGDDEKLFISQISGNKI